MTKFMSAEFSVEGKTVTGAPYSAEAVTETTQTLADGNRIANRNTAVLARDSQGRTRRQQSINPMGPWSGAGASHTVVFINDPVAQVSYVLDADSHTARKNSIFSKVLADKVSKRIIEVQGKPGMVMVTPGAEGGAATQAERQIKHQAEMAALGIMGYSVQGPVGETTTESLGSKLIEGVQAEGTRFTRTIPAGQIGNDRALIYENEVWTSPDLQAIVMSRHKDPQMGETVYTLTHIQRGEPDPALFSIPAGYTVVDGGNQFYMVKPNK